MEFGSPWEVDRVEATQLRPKGRVMPYEVASRGLFSELGEALRTWAAPVPSPLVELKLHQKQGKVKRRVTGESDDTGTEAGSEPGEKQEESHIKVRLKPPQDRKMRGKTVELSSKPQISIGKNSKTVFDNKPKAPFRAGTSSRLLNTAAKPYLPTKPLVLSSFRSPPRLKQSLKLPIKSVLGLGSAGKEREVEVKMLEELRRGPIELRSGLRSARRSAEQSHDREGLLGSTPKSLQASVEWDEVTDLVPRKLVPMQTPRPNHLPF